MFGLFTSRVMTSDGIDLLQRYIEYIRQHNLVLNGHIVWPTIETFGPLLRKWSNEESERGYFEQVIAHYGLQGIDFELCPHASARQLNMDGFAGERLTNDPGGTYTKDEHGRPVITFDPKLLERPVDLIAVFSHELCHYIIHEKIKNGHPDGMDDEVMTDVMSILNGYGIFALRSCFREENWANGNMSGWSIKNSGYLSINETAYLLALVTRMDCMVVERVKNHLDGMHLRKYKNALRQAMDV